MYFKSNKTICQTALLTNTRTKLQGNLKHFHSKTRPIPLLMNPPQAPPHHPINVNNNFASNYSKAHTTNASLSQDNLLVMRGVQLYKRFFLYAPCLPLLYSKFTLNK